MKYIITVGLIILNVFFSYSQINTYKLNCHLDFDNQLDQIIVEKGTGQNEDFCSVSFSFAKNKKIISISPYGYPSSFLGILPIPNEVKKIEKNILKKLSQYVFNLKYDIEQKPEIKWLSTIINNRTTDLRNKKIDFFSFFQPEWLAIDISNMQGYTNIVRTKQYKNFYKILPVEDLPYPTKVYEKYLVANFSHNHAVIKCEEKNIPIVCISNHGVLVKKGSFFSWMFINDANIFGFGSEKLRWPSIKKAICVNNHLFILAKSVTTQINVLYIINMANGKLIRVSNSYFGIISIEDFKIENNGELVIKQEKKEMRVLIADFFK